MRIRMAGLITVVMMLAMVSSVAAFAVDTVGTIKYENGTTCPYGWTVCMENLNETYFAEPWSVLSSENPPFWNYLVVGESESTEHYVRVNVTSPDGRWFGENVSKLADVFNTMTGFYWIDLVVEEQEQPADTFTKSLPAGWNLISLPLTPLDNGTSAVLGNDTITYDVVYRYDATSKEFVDVTTGTMDTGIGYFVNVMTAGIWEYEGTPETSTSTGLKTGLNMIGVPNCMMSVDYAMGSVDYRYVARWDAADQEFEVYNPSAPVAFWHFDTMEPGEGYFVSAKSDYISPPWEINCPS